MADRGDTHYHVPTLNWWFLGSSAFFLLTMVWTVVDDWDAEWKNYQRDFRALELQLQQDALAAAEAEGALLTEEQLQAKVDAAQAALDEKGDELAEAEHQADIVLKEERFVAEEAFKKAKSIQGWEAWVTEKRLLSESKKADDPAEFDAEWIRAQMAGYMGDVYELELAFQEKDGIWQEAVANVEALKAELSAAEADLAAGTRDLTRIREKIDNLDPAELPKQAANIVRDFPGLDFIGPNLKVEKFVLDHITFNLNFTKKPRIDMCTTCHMGMERPEFADAPQPHTAHPRLDLFLTSKSPHPIKDVGCTVCHSGSGESLGFQHADHRPSDYDEKKRWKEDYSWHKQKYWDYPMLRTQNVEAGCVQCHKTSMELIADDAPTMFEGYELFETKGCYSCHKVDWFPTDRKPGPTLKNLASKLDEDFVYSWIAKPREFRPKTHMPQVFHLENFDAEEVVVVSEFGQGRDIMGAEWNDAAVAAVTAFLFDKAPLQALPDLPADMTGDADRGREVMTLNSCFACHNTEPYEEGGAEPPVLSNLATGNGHGVGKNEMGPNLRGVASKVTKEWLYHWLVDPQSYWEETRMPNPRLDSQDALDIATYIMEDPDGIFGDVPDGWAVDGDWREKLKLDVLQEQARWFYQSEGQAALESKLTGDWADPDVLASKVGEAFVTHQGCFSCHLIDGMEDYMPIGVELSTWASKTVDKLDFGQHYLQDVSLPSGFVADNGISEEDRTLKKLDKYYREGWIERKLDHPRSFDLNKFKTPKDKLRMPWFDLSEREILAISTFVLGQVEDEVGQAAMFPNAEQKATEAGKRAVRQNNCASCHMIDPPTVTFLDDSGAEVTVQGEIQPVFLEDPLPPRMTSVEDLLADVQVSEDYMEEEVEEFTVRLLGVDPEHGLPADPIFVGKDRVVGVTPGDGGDFIRLVTEYYKVGSAFLPNEEYDPANPDETGPAFYPATLGWDEDESVNLIEDVDGQQRPYPNEQYDKVRWTFAPPVLWNEGAKVQTDWFYAFLKDPMPLRAQMRVKMPKFHFDHGEAEAVADYFAAKSRWEWHAQYAKTLRLALGRTTLPDLEDGSTANEWNLEEAARDYPVLSHTTEHGVLSVVDLAALMAEYPAWTLSAQTIAAIEAGSKPETLASFDKLKAFGDSVGFSMAGPIKVGHELIERRTPSYMDVHAGLSELGESVGVNGVNCYQCHDNPDDAGPYVGLDPVAWAPSLQHVRSRLREEWVRDWLWGPKRTYPGTAMPDNFAAHVPQYREHYPGSSNADQVEAVLNWLYNMDRPKSQ